MKLNPFHWLNERPVFRVTLGWLLLVGVVIIDWAWGPAITCGPFYCVPVILLSYDTKLWRGLIVAVIAGLAWMLLSTNAGVSMWRGLSEEPVVSALGDIPKPLQAKLVKLRVIIPPMDPKTAIPTAVTLWIIGTVGFALVAFGFHTIRLQEHELALAEHKRIKREKELLSAISSTLTHEINNPLAIIAAQASVMATEKSEGGNGARAKHIRNIQDAVGRIADFVKELAALEEVRLKSVMAGRLHIDWQRQTGERAAQPPNKTVS